MRVQIVDPSAYTPPYDHALCAALARAGRRRRAGHEPFPHGPVPGAEGYGVEPRRSTGAPPSGLEARGAARSSSPSTAPDMLRYRAPRRGADIVHFQWLTVPALDAHLLPRPPARAHRRTACSAASAAGGASAAARRLWSGWTPSSSTPSTAPAAARRARRRSATRVHVIPHGAFDYLTRLPDEAPLPPELRGVEGPVVLLLRPDPPLQGGRRPARGLPRGRGRRAVDRRRPLGADGASCERPRALRRDRALRRPLRRRRGDPRALPPRRRGRAAYRDAEQSGVLYTALAFGKAIVLSDVGGFAEVAEHGAGRSVAAGDRRPRRGAERAPRDAGRARAPRGRRGAGGRAGAYSWDAIAAQHPRPIPSGCCDRKRGMIVLQSSSGPRRAPLPHARRLPADARRARALRRERRRRRRPDGAARRHPDRRRPQRGGR